MATVQRRDLIVNGPITRRPERRVTLTPNNDNGLQGPPLRSWSSIASGALGDLA